MSFIGGLLSTKTDSIPNLVNSPGLSQDNPYSQQFGQDAAQQQAIAAQMQGYANNGAQAQSATQQQAFANQLMAQANGQGPSVAQAMMNNALQQNVANTNALAASQKGNVNPVLAQRMAMQQNAQGAQQAAQTGMTGRMQEQLNAQGQLGNTLSQMRGQDIQNSGMYNNLGLNYGALASQNNAQGLNAANMNLNASMNANSINAGIATGNTASQNNVTGGILNAAGAVGAGFAKRAHGGVIPGQAQIKGDSTSNDTVPTMLSPGEIVIPRTMASDSEKAKAFIDHLMSSKEKRSDKTGYAKVLEAHRSLKSIEQRLSKIESKVGKK